MATVAELAWAAGLIDGEGCICIVRTEATVFGHNCVSPRHRLLLKVTMCDKRPITKLKEIFQVGTMSSREGTERTSTSYTWLCNREATLIVLKQLRKYFILKGEEADLAFQFGDLAFRAQGRTAVDNKELMKREQLFQQMRALKSRSRFRDLGKKSGRKHKKRK